MVDLRIAEALSVIGHHIQEYENADNPEEIFKTQIDRNRYKRSLYITILTSIKVLNAITENEYHWIRCELKDGNFYSGICQRTNGKEIEVTENYAEEQKRKE